MPTKKNRGTESRNLPVHSLAHNLDQPTHFGEPHHPTDYLFHNIQGGTAVKGGKGSKQGQLAHGTDTTHKVSLPRHSGKKVKGLYPKGS